MEVTADKFKIAYDYTLHLIMWSSTLLNIDIYDPTSIKWKEKVVSL